MGPGGFARGFLALSDYAEVQYKCTETWNPKAEVGILWNDPDIGVQWPVPEPPYTAPTYPVVSEKDRNAKPLQHWLDSEAAKTSAL